MKNRLIVLLLSFHLAIIGIGQNDDVPRTLENWTVGAGYFNNMTYGYGGFSLYTQTAPFAMEKLGASFSYNGFRLIKPLIGEYSQLNLEGTYLLHLAAKGDYIQGVLIRAGGSLIIDFTNTQTLGTAGRIGMTYTGQYGRFLFSLDNTLTFFSDGMWVDPTPGISYQIHKGFHAKIDIMLPIAFTYNGNSDIGQHARIGIFYNPG